MSPGLIVTLVVIVAAFALATSIATAPSRQSNVGAPPTNTKRAVAQAATTVAPSKTPTPLASLTPSNTLKPPPTFEPPTATVPASLTPSATATQTIDLSISIPGLFGLQSPTPSVPEGCQKRKDWKLTYTVQRKDALSRIADVYGTTVDALIKGNCLVNKDVIVIGQVLKVPGTNQPSTPPYACLKWEVLTPFDGELDVPTAGNLTFDWHGPLVPYTLIRVLKPDNITWEHVIPLRQNETVEILDEFPMGGNYTWQMFPLDKNFQQTCPESPVYHFTKAVSPTRTPTPTRFP
jgi:LysM repeat protein